MEESKELQKLYGFMQAFIYITVCIEILLFVHFPFSEQIMPLLSKMAKIPIYSNILYSKLFTFFIIMVTCIGEGGNLAASKIRNLECPSYEICLIDYGCGKFNRKIHIMEQYP